MNRQDIANLAFKITGLYCLIQAIPHLAMVLDIPTRYSWAASLGNRPGIAVWPILLRPLPAFGLVAGLGIYLLTRSAKLAQRVFPAADARPAPERILAIHALAYSIVGIFFIADALPGLVGVLVGIAAQWQRFNLRQYAPSTIEPAVKLALGIALFFGSHGLVRLWSRLRYAGIREKLGICIRCGYDLTGNTSGICPECGTPTRGQSPPAT